MRMDVGDGSELISMQESSGIRLDDLVMDHEAEQERRRRVRERRNARLRNDAREDHRGSPSNSNPSQWTTNPHRKAVGSPVWLGGRIVHSSSRSPQGHSSALVPRSPAPVDEAASGEIGWSCGVSVDSVGSDRSIHIRAGGRLGWRLGQQCWLGVAGFATAVLMLDRLLSWLF